MRADSPLRLRWSGRWSLTTRILAVNILALAFLVGSFVLEIAPGQTVKQSNFRSVYDAVVIAVHRNAERVPGKIGDIQLRPGDTLLMQCAPEFMRLHRNSRDFFLVSQVALFKEPSSSNRRFERVSMMLTHGMDASVPHTGHEAKRDTQNDETDCNHPE